MNTISGLPTKAISIKQPWAWMIVNGLKDIENRTWKTTYRGPVLIHASQRPVQDLDFKRDLYARKFGITLPKKFDYGGIVGVATITECVSWHPSRWFEGPWGFVFKEPRPLPFRKCPGRLYIFCAPKDV